MVTVEVHDAIGNIRNPESNLFTTITSSDDLPSDFDPFTGWQFIQGNLVDKVEVAFSERVHWQQSDSDEVADPMTFQCRLQFWEQCAAALNVTDWLPSCFAYGDAISSGKGVLHSVSRGFGLLPLADAGLV
jgi:hypothetical protein